MLYQFDPDYCYILVEDELYQYVLERDNRLCILCGRDGEQVHHIIMKSLCHHHVTPNYANNLALLCKKCHDKQHGVERKGEEALQGIIKKNEARLRKAIS
jgi:5-methylcytosine-specific restriction endonuclease McrA